MDEIKEESFYSYSARLINQCISPLEYILRFPILIGMVEYWKEAKGDYYHWRKECTDYPIKGKDTVLTFKKRPSHLQPCPICQELEEGKEK